MRHLMTVFCAAATMLATTGCTVGQRVDGDGIEMREKDRTYYFLGFIPVFERKQTYTSEVPD